MFGDKQRTVARGWYRARTLVLVVVAAIAATSLTVAPAHAAGLTTVYAKGSTQFTDFIDPLNESLGKTDVGITFTWSNGIDVFNLPYCQIDAKITVYAASTNSQYLSGLEHLYTAALNVVPSSPNKNIWVNNTLIGNGSQFTSTLKPQTFTGKCSAAWAVGFDKSTFFNTPAGTTVLGLLSNILFNAAFIGTMIGLGTYLAHYYPAYLLQTHVQSAVSALSGAMAQFISTLVVTKFDYNAASAAAAISACITFFTEVPYLAAWQNLLTQAYAAVGEAGANGAALATFTTAQWLRNAAAGAGGNMWAWIANNMANVQAGAIGGIIGTLGFGNWNGQRNQVVEEVAVQVNNQVFHQVNPQGGCA